MSQNPGLSNQNSEELFAAAIARLEAGEPLEVILASYPAEQQAELQEFLQIVEATVQLQRAPAPRPSPARRAARKQAFLQAAAELKADYTAPTPLAPLSVAAPRQIKQTPGLFARMRDGWAAFQASFAIRPMSLAPLVGMIVAVWLGGFGFVTLAKAYTPGDPGYAVRQWIWHQELYLTPEERRGEVAARQEKEQAEVVVKAGHKANENQQFIQAEDILIFHGYERNYMQIGLLNVLMSYEPGNNSMTLEGTPGEGDLVHLVYQIVPGQPTVSGKPLVQGIAMRVLVAQIFIPPTPTATAIPTTPPADTPTALPTDTAIPPTSTSDDTTAPGECVVSAPSGWAPYRIQAGQSLAELAARAGISVAQLLQVNCLTSEAVIADTLILAPAGINIEQTPTVEVTPTEGDTPTVDMTPTTAVTATMEASPTATENTPTATALPITATAITTSTIAPTEVVTATPTLASTITPSNTAQASPTNTSEATPSATSTVTPLTTPEATEETPTPTDAADGTATPTPAETATPGGQETSQPETATATEAPATDTPIPAEGATTTPTTAEVGPGEAPTATHTPLPVDTPTPSATLPPLPTEEPTVSGAGVKDFATATFTPTAFRTVAPMPTATRTVPPPNESPLRSPK